MPIPPPEEIRWPTTLSVTDVQWQLENISRSGGQTLSGHEQVVSAATSRWTLSLSVLVGSRSQIDCYRALMGYLRGRSRIMLMPAFELNWSPASLAFGCAFNLRGFSNGAYFSNGARFELAGTYAVLSDAADEFATELTLSSEPTMPDVGTYFGIRYRSGERRLHIFTNFDGDDTYKIEPPLRTACDAGQFIQLERPQCSMRLVTDTEGPLERSREQYQMPQLKFVEVF